MLQPFKKYLEYMPMTIKGVLVGYTLFANDTSANIDERPLIFHQFRCHFGIA
jgi:hypothetical protein